MTPSQDPPVANDDTVTVTEDTATNVTAGILANDTDPDGDTLTVTGVSNATGGSVVLQAGVVTFTPDANLCGAATGSFDYDISDGHGGSDTGHATVNITCVNDAPHAVNDSASGPRTPTSSIAGADLVSNDTDTEGDSLSVTAVSNATGGTAVLGAGDVTFTPDANLCGNNVAGFDYTVERRQRRHRHRPRHHRPRLRSRRPRRERRHRHGRRGLVQHRRHRRPARQRHGRATATRLTITDVDNATGGSVDLTAGNVTFTPDADACGDGYGGFDYTVDDGNGGIGHGPRHRRRHLRERQPGRHRRRRLGHRGHRRRHPEPRPRRPTTATSTATR